MAKKVRNCFVSYHHERDQHYVRKLRKLAIFQTIRYIRKFAIRPRACSVTVVLIVERTGHINWIDWEIWASLRAYNHPLDPMKSFKPNGLLAIFLPVESHSVPNGLQDNIDSGYAVSFEMV